MSLLQLKDVCRRYKIKSNMLGLQTGVITAVDHVSLELRKGETLGLVGESGCGKSTLGRVAMGMEPPTSGQVLLEGKPLEQWNTKERHRQMQMIFQDPYSSLNPRQKIGSAIRESLDIHGIGSRSERKAKVERLLSLVGLSAEYGTRYPHEFSGGQRQRIAVARALALEPEVVICDEPVSALDVSVQAQVLNLLSDLQDEFGLTYLFISHDLSVVGHISDRVAVMYLGRIVELAESSAFFERPLHPYSEALLSAALPADPHSKISRIPLQGELPSPLNPPSGCAFHPRCPKVMDRCSADRPTLKEISPGRQVACWLHSDS